MHERTSKCIRAPRKGSAPIEAIFFTPLLITLITTLLWIFKVQDQSISLLTRIQEDAELQSVLIVEQTALATTQQLPIESNGALATLVKAFSPQLTPAHGLVLAEGSETISQGLPGAPRAGANLGEASGSYSLLAHSWGRDVFTFPTSKSQQPPLTLPSSMRGIAPSFREYKTFQALRGFLANAPP